MIDWKRLRTDGAYCNQVVTDLVTKHQYALVEYCATWLGVALAEDVTQQVFIVIWQKLPTFQPHQPIEHWLYAIAKKECQRVYRNTSRRREIVADFDHEIREIAHRQESQPPEALMEAEQHRARLVDSLRQLRDEDRLLLHLRYRRSLTVADIADTLGTSVKAMEKRLERARGRLREYMGDDTAF